MKKLLEQTGRDEISRVQYDPARHPEERLPLQPSRLDFFFCSPITIGVISHLLHFLSLTGWVVDLYCLRTTNSAPNGVRVRTTQTELLAIINLAFFLNEILGNPKYQ